MRDDNRTNTLAIPDTAETIPVMRDDDGPALGKRIKPGMSLKFDMDGLKLSLPLPALAAPMLLLINGKRTLAQIHAEVQSSQQPAPDWETFKQQFDELFSSLYGLSRMFLRKAR